MKIILTVVLALLGTLSFSINVDESAMLLYDESFDRAIYAFAIAKGLNAIISVIQSSEVSASFFLGATVGIGQIVDPINDLIERFSWIMLASTVSIGIQKLLLILGKSLFIKIALSISVIISLLTIWIKKLNLTFTFVFSLKIVLFFLVLRFGAIIFIYSTQMFFTQVYAQQYASSTQFMSEYKVELQEIQKKKQNLDSFWSKIEEKMEVFSEKIIKLITMFVVTTVVLPLLFLWFMLVFLRWIFNLKFDSDKVLILLNK